MARPPKAGALEAFEANIADADMLLGLATALKNQRVYRMRAELRERVGEALGVPKTQREGLDCIESDDLFVVLKATGAVTRDDLKDDALRPLMRQAVVAIAAAVETYVADRVMELYGAVVGGEELPRRLAEFPMTIGDWHQIERDYQRRGWGIRELVTREVQRRASASSSQMGMLFSAVGAKDLLKRVDVERKTTRGRSEAQLDEIAERRNRIAHSGDRLGQGRATISVDEVTTYARNAQDIVEAIDVIT